MIKFNCTSCGICCKKVGGAVELSRDMVKNGSEDERIKEIAAFPYSCDESGKCEMLGEDNLCKVYGHRPDICNVKKFYEKYYTKVMSNKEFFEENEKICKQWQSQ